MKSTAKTVEEYLAKLPADRRETLSQVRDTVNANLPAGFEEGMSFGYPAWYVPLARYPTTYNKQPLMLAALGSQKQYMALYLMSVYGNEDLAVWFRDQYAERGVKLDMGKSCVRFKSLAGIPLDVIGETIGKISVDDYIKAYEAVKGSAKVTQKTNKRTGTKKMVVRAKITKRGKSVKVKIKATQRRGKGPVKIRTRVRRSR